MAAPCKKDGGMPCVVCRGEAFESSLVARREERPREAFSGRPEPALLNPDGFPHKKYRIITMRFFI